jgi:sulfide:quinone oxidoreductase
VKKRVLILGAGFGGLELATRLSETVPDAVRVTLLDRNDAFFFGFSKLEVMLGRQSAEEVKLYYRDIAKNAVEFRQETVTGIDAAARRVTTDAGSYDADFVVVALGADYDMAATPGFEAGGHEYYTLAGAERLCDALADFDVAEECLSPSSGNRSSARRLRSRGASCSMSTSRSAASATRCRCRRPSRCSAQSR